MGPNSFIYQGDTQQELSGRLGWQAPSNIALVKYWGKKPDQIPTNASISFTLNHCHTETIVEFSPSDHFGFDIKADGKIAPHFAPKISTFFDRIKHYCPYIEKYHWHILTTNSFPHSSGIASSASGFAALALCVCSLERKLNPEMTDVFFYKKASFLARLGSGSAARSLYPGMVSWGQTNAFANSNNLFGTSFMDYHKVFSDFQDTILIVDKGQKKVGSTAGHDLMNNHPFATQRFAQAGENMKRIKAILQSGDLMTFTQIVESEALTLHAMMMTSNPYYILMKANTLDVIERVWDYRQQTGINFVVTLDAGANVHLLYPKLQKTEALEFIHENLLQFCENEQYICDEVGTGPKLLDV